MGIYTRRGIEHDLVAHVEAALRDPLERLSIALVTGPTGYGAAEVLARGVADRLVDSGGSQRTADRITGDWTDSERAIRYSLAESDIPATAPPPQSPIRVLLVACSDVDALPAWVQEERTHRVRTVPMRPLSLFEAHEFIETALEGACDIATAHTFARLAGYAPEPLRIILEESRRSGVLGQISDGWALMGDPVTDAIVPYLQAQISAVDPAYAEAMCVLALLDPFTLEELPPELASIAAALLRAGELRWRTDGRVAFLAPGGMRALRSIAPERAREQAAEIRTERAEPANCTDEHRTMPQEARELLQTARDTIARGRPDEILPGLVRSATPEHTPAGVPRAYFRDAGTVLVWATLSAHGPRELPEFAAQLGEFATDPTDLDLTQRYGLRAFWEAARGNIGQAHRLGALALEHAHDEDPEQLAGLLRALLAETTALRGEHARSVQLVESCAEVQARHPLEDALIRRHLSAAEQLLAFPQAGSTLWQRAQDALAAGAFGGAAEIAYSGVRFGRRRSAQLLVQLSPHLSGAMHRTRVSQARAILAEDPVALLQAAQELRSAGYGLWAAEADAGVLRMPDVPASVQNRATQALTAFLGQQSLPGHAQLRTPRGAGSDARLTPRESEIAELMHAGLSNADIADRLHVSIGTIEGHITRIYRKTGGSRRSPARRRS